MTEDEYEAWYEQYDNYSYTDLMDSLYDKLCDIERLQKQVDDLKAQVEKQNIERQESIAYQEKIDNYRDWEDSISRDRYKDQDLGPVW